MLNLFISNGFLPQIDSQLHTEESLKVWVGGRLFRNPLGVAAGFDASGKSTAQLLNLGFGFCEVGSCTNTTSSPESTLRINKGQPEWTSAKNANSIPGTKAILINNMRRIKSIRNSIVGVNIGLSEETMQTVPYLAEMDYMAGISEFSDSVDYLVINLTAPHSCIAVDQYKDKDILETLLMKLREKREKELGIIAACEQELVKDITRTDIPLISRMYRKPELLTHIPPLLFLKVPCDMAKEQVINLGLLAEKYSIDGIIVASQLVDKELHSKMQIDTLQTLYKTTNGNIPLISVGGILDGKEAYKRIKAGASLLQVCSGLLLEGPYIGIRILRELHNEIKKEQISSIQEIIGNDCKFLMKV